MTQINETLLNTALNSLQKNCIEITPKTDVWAPAWGSRLGGGAYLPNNYLYPHLEGEPLHLLAQINLSEMPAGLSGMPGSGLLQFYINSIDTGINLCFLTTLEQKKTSSIKVLYFESFDENNFSLIQTNMTDSPLIDPLFPTALAFTLGKSLPSSLNDLNIDKAWKQTYGGAYLLNQAIKEILRNHEDNHSFFQIGGYPHFVQEDPRISNTNHQDKTFLLLQIDSDENTTCWGDSGIAQFMINPLKLSQKDFTDVLFDWNSC